MRILDPESFWPWIRDPRSRMEKSGTRDSAGPGYCVWGAQFSEEQLYAKEHSETEGPPWISLYVFPYPDGKWKLGEDSEYFDDLILLGWLVMLRLNFTSLPPKKKAFKPILMQTLIPSKWSHQHYDHITKSTILNKVNLRWYAHYMCKEKYKRRESTCFLYWNLNIKLFSSTSLSNS